MISALFCSVNPRGVIIIAALPAHSWRAVWMGRSFLHRTELYRQTKLYAKYHHFDDSGPDRNIHIHIHMNY